VVNYGPGGNYLPHFDFLVPSNPLAAESIARSGQRISTLIMAAYLRVWNFPLRELQRRGRQ